MNNIAKIAIEKVAYKIDVLYAYIIPKEYTHLNLVGCKVIVPFGRGNSKRQGIVLSTEEISNMDNISGLKKILAVLDDQVPLLSREMISLSIWMKSMYYCTYFEAIHAMLPSGLNYKIVYYYGIAKIPDNSSNEINLIINYFKKYSSVIQKEKIIKDLKINPESNILEKLVRSGILFRTDSIIRKTQDSKVKMVRIVNHNDLIKLTEKQLKVLKFIENHKKVSLKEICYDTGVTKCVVDNLVKKNILEYYEDLVIDSSINIDNCSIIKKDIVLTPEQNTAYKSLKDQYQKSTGSVSLLYGITGSGKTSVFMKLVEDVYNQNRDIIVMVPEISLTPQAIHLFKIRFGNNIAVFHSSLSLNERIKEWKRVKYGKVKIVVGTRSSVFAPFNNLGLIIIDEEQEHTYKSESSPRFNAKDIARFRIKYNKGLLVLASATPSVETFFYAKNGRYSLNILSNRYGTARLPKVTIVDMNTEISNGNLSPISSVLLESLKRVLNERKQAIILLNRRGYNTFASCKSCGTVLSCLNCSISMTYHKANNRIMCHYCGYSKEFTNECPNCSQHQVIFSGMGTQKIEQVISNLLPEARILRMDADTTMSKSSHKNYFQKFLDKEYDIMIGTQMVAKGLDFPNVVLVGIVSADQSLYSEDFRSYEKAFSLFTQVIGRSGRGNYQGHAIIQTLTPYNFIIKLSSEQKYENFFDNEIKLRELMLYPPFSDIFVIGFIGTNKIKIEQASIFFRNMIEQFIKNNYQNIPVRIFGPSPASIKKVINKYRYKIILKTRNSSMFREMMSKLLIEFQNNKIYNKISVFFDINPDIIM